MEPTGRDQEKEMLVGVVVILSSSTSGLSGAGTSENRQPILAFW